MDARTCYVLPLLVVVLAVAVHRADGLRCYACSSSTATNCGDPFNKTKMRMEDCERLRTAGSQDRAYCQKIQESVHNGESRIIRKCVFSHEILEGTCAEMSSHDVIKTEYCSTCVTDECNAAPRSSLPSAAAVAALMLPTLAWSAARTLQL